MFVQYDAIGASYEDINDLPAHAPLAPTVQDSLGSIKGLRVLDLACGSGHWTRILAGMGAERVVGVDISERMVEDAWRTSMDFDNVEYHLADCSRPMTKTNGESFGHFDVVFAAWFLNYAGTSEELLGMWRNIYSSLKPGGRVIAIVPNLDNDLWEPLDPRYGTYFYAVQEVNKGKPDEGLLCHMKALTQPPIEFDCYRLSRNIFEQTASMAGVRNLEWHYPILPLDDNPDGYWDEYKRRPHFLLISASRFQDLDVPANL